MNKESYEMLLPVIRSLNSIEVKGKKNLINLSGCISILEDIYQAYIDATQDREQSPNTVSAKE